MEAAPPPPKRRSVGGDATNTAPEMAASRKRKSTDAADPMMRAAAARRRSLGGKRKSRGSPTATDATGDASRKRTSVGDGTTSRKRRSLTTDDGVAARVKRRRSLEGAPLFSPPDEKKTPAKASPGAAELGFFSPAASAKRSKAWSVRASARRAADAWADHDGWLPSSKRRRGGVPRARREPRLPAGEAVGGLGGLVATGQAQSCSWKLVMMRRSRPKLVKTSSGRCGARPYFRDGDGAVRSLAAFLRTRAAEDTSVGYVQGMNYVAAFCLLVARGDADADANPAPTSATTPRAPTMHSGRSPGCVEATTSTASRRCTATSACSQIF